MALVRMLLALRSNDDFVVSESACRDAGHAATLNPEYEDPEAGDGETDLPAANAFQGCLLSRRRRCPHSRRDGIGQSGGARKQCPGLSPSSTTSTTLMFLTSATDHLTQKTFVNSSPRPFSCILPFLLPKGLSKVMSAISVFPAGHNIVRIKLRHVLRRRNRSDGLNIWRVSDARWRSCWSRGGGALSTCRTV